MMVKKFVIALDSQVPSFSSDKIRMFMYSNESKFKHDTFEDAEKALEKTLDLGEDHNVYTIIPIYFKR